MVAIRPYTSRLSAAIVRDREQPVPGPKHLVEKRFGVAEVPTGDLLLQLPDVLGQLGGVVRASAPSARRAARSDSSNP